MKNIKKHRNALKNHLFTLFLSLFGLTVANAQFEPWCFETAEADYEAAEEFMSSISPSAALSSEMDIPIQVVYMNEDDGTPPGSGIRWSEVITEANTYFEGLFNFYICGYHHVNSSDLSDLDYANEKIDLFNAYHSDQAINLYILSYIDRTRAEFPWYTPNNAVYTAAGIDGYTLAHELGHYFGLFHTHPALYLGPNNCSLHPPSYEADQVTDTNYDPGPNSVCSTVCPVLSSCTLTCNLGGIVTYTYTDIPTGNVMSYHQCSNKTFTSGQFDRMTQVLTNHVNRTFLLDAASCNNNIAEDGFIIRYCNSATTTVDDSPVKDIRVAMSNQTSGYDNILRSRAPDGHYEVYRNSYSNISSVNLSPEKSHPVIQTDPTSAPLNYQPLNGLTTYDMLRVSQHILGINYLDGPYARIAADANGNGSITTFDIIMMRRVLLGLDLDFGAGTWRFVPELYFSDSNFASDFELASSPFGIIYNGVGYNGWMDELTLDMDDDFVAGSDPWSFRAIKVGDVNCTMVVDEFSPTDDGLVTLASNASNCVEEDDVITVEVNGQSSSSIVGYQLGFDYNFSDLQFLGTSSGTLSDFSQDNFAATTGEIRATWLKNNMEGESLSTPKTLFKLHFKVLNDFCDIQDKLSLSSSVLPNFMFDSDGESVGATATFVYQATIPDGRLLSISPNPSTTSLTLGFQANTTATVEISLSDYFGNTLQNSQQYSPGNYSYTFSNLSSLTAGALNYSVKINNVTYTGIVIKS